MPDEEKWLFQTDPERFWQIVKNDNWQERLTALDTYGNILVGEAVRYGFFNNQDMIGPLTGIYREFAMKKMPEEERYAASRHAADFVAQTTVVSINALLPFIVEDISRPVVSTAVIDYVSLGSLTDGDPMSRVKDIIGMIERNILKNEGAAFGGLLHIGDKRVCDLLIPLRDSFDQDALREVVQCSNGLVHSATAEFYLDWLEGVQGTTFDLVASGLGLLKKRSQIDQVYTGHRPFPTRGITLEQWNAAHKPIPLADYVKRIAPRMYALERAESPPRIMPHVLTDWGIEPLTDPADTAVLG
jgi:hypothetical protein